MSLTRGDVKAMVVILLGVVSAGVTAAISPQWPSAVFLLLSVLLGARGRTNPLGSILEAVGDRVSEALWALAFYRLGAPLLAVLALWALAGFQEYARARVGSAGVREMGIMTPSERPVRALILFVAILIAQTSLASPVVSILAIIAALLQAYSFVLVMIFARRKLAIKV